MKIISRGEHHDNPALFASAGAPVAGRDLSQLIYIQRKVFDTPRAYKVQHVRPVK